MVVQGGLFTVGEMLQWAVLFLGKENRLEAELLLAHALESSRPKLLAYPEAVIDEKKAQLFKELIGALSQGEPLQYLLGRQNFMGLDFFVNSQVLIPRSDTEVLVEEAIKITQGLPKPIKILDLCTGSGAIAISLAKYIEDAQIIATDISPEALEVAEKNARHIGVIDKITFYQGDLFEPLAGNHSPKTFDLIVSNPPYITTQEMEVLSIQVKKEPQLALWGGEDGLDLYRQIIPQAPQYLKEGAFLLVEIGYEQTEAVTQIYKEAGLEAIQVLKDWSGNDRVIKGRIR